MIAHLRGTLLGKHPNLVIVDTGGVGYEITIPVSTYSSLPETGIEVHQVLPIGVNTELYSGVSQARGFKTPEPQDVANTIVELLQTGKFEAYVPKYLGLVVRFNALMPRRVTEAVTHLTKGDRVLLDANSGARAAYDARMAEMINGSATASEPEAERSAA